jgi:hypothetical protein
LCLLNIQIIFLCRLEAVQAMQYLKVRKPDKRENCINCDYYLGKADSIHIALKKN